MKKEILLVIILGLIMVALGGILVWQSIEQGANRPNPLPAEGIKINLPKANDEISSPAKITGVVNGNGWAPFEAQAGTVRLLDANGKELAFGILTSVGDWMKLPSNFETTLNFVSEKDQSGTLVFKNENASGEPSRDKTYSLPVKILKTETMAVKAYFGKTEITGATCTEVFPVERIVAKTEAVAKAALEELLKGPTEAEKAQGYFSSINPGVKIQSLTIENGVAKVDFDEELERAVGGSCRVAEIRSEINSTLKQFSTVKSVIISINGRTEDILQP